MNENETNIISKMSIKVIGGGVYLKNKPQTITITWEIKDENGNIITPDTLSVNNIPLDPTTTSKTYHRVFSDVDFTVRAVKDGVLAIGTTTARFVGPTQTVEDSLTSNSRSIAASANSVRLLNEKIENNNSFKGLFTSLDDLKKKLRSGNNGDWAIVGEGIPAPIYIWNKNGWEATGGQYTGSTIDLDSYYTKEDVANYTDDYNVSKNHSHIVKIYDLVNWKVVERKPDAPVFQLGQSYDAGEVVNMTDDNDSSYECLQATITAPYLSQEVRSFTLAEAISFLPEDLRVTGQKISFLSSELNAWMTYVFTGGDYTNPTYWEIFTNNIDPDTNQKIADLQAKDEDLQNQINEDVTNLNNHIAESDAKFEEIDNTLTEHEDRMDDIEDEILLSSVEAACAPKDVEILADRAYKDHLGNIIADEYITRDTLTEEIIDITNQQVTDLKPGSVQPEDLSEAVKQMIGCKKITNLPDEEDITVTGDNTLKFKDREYSPKDYSGMGKKILRKHYIDGINTLTQHMINKPNTIYVIRYDYCLQGQTIEIPENCVLEFQGGSLANGSVYCSRTYISYSNTLFFKNVILSGDIVNDIIKADWFSLEKSEDNHFIFNNLDSLLKLESKNTILLGGYTYEAVVDDCMMTTDTYLKGIGRGRTTLYLSSNEESSKFYIGINTRCGISDMDIIVQDNSEKSIIYTESATSGTITADWEQYIVNIRITNSQFWSDGSDIKNCKTTGIKFSISPYSYDGTFKKMPGYALSYRGNYSGVELKNFYKGVVICTASEEDLEGTGLTHQNVWTTSIQLDKFTIWAKYGIVGEGNNGRYLVTDYINQSVTDSSDNNLCYAIYGTFNNLILDNMVVWDTSYRGMADGVIYDNSPLAYNSYISTPKCGFKPLTTDEALCVYNTLPMSSNLSFLSNGGGIPNENNRVNTFTPFGEGAVLKLNHPLLNQEEMQGRVIYTAREDDDFVTYRVMKGSTWNGNSYVRYYTNGNKREWINSKEHPLDSVPDASSSNSFTDGSIVKKDGHYCFNDNSKPVFFNTFTLRKKIIYQSLEDIGSKVIGGIENAGNGSHINIDYRLYSNAVGYDIQGTLYINIIGSNIEYKTIDRGSIFNPVHNYLFNSFAFKLKYYKHDNLVDYLVYIEKINSNLSYYTSILLDIDATYGFTEDEISFSGSATDVDIYPSFTSEYVCDSSHRPVLNNYDKVISVFDTTLGKQIWHNGTDWVDATGATV